MVHQHLEGFAGGVLSLVVLTALGAGYTVLASRCQRRWGSVGLGLLWMLAILGAAYWGFSRAADYQSRAMLAHGLVAAVGLSPATLLVAHLARTQPASRLSWQRTLLGGAGLVAGALVVTLAYSAARRWTCDSQSFRRDDGSIGSACEMRESSRLFGS